MYFLECQLSSTDETKIRSGAPRQDLDAAKKINRDPSAYRDDQVGGRPRSDLRKVIEGIVHILRAGHPWRDMPKRYGPWSTVYGWFRRWCREGLWARLLEVLAKRASGKLRFIDGAYIRVHQDGAPALQHADNEGVGTSRGGRSSKIHALVDLDGRPLKLIITPGNHHDLKPAPELIEGLQEVIVVADKGYDSKRFREQIAEGGNRSCIPVKKNAKTAHPHNRSHYKKRHRVENFFGRIKRLRRIATRYEKTRSSFEGMLLISCVLDWIR